MRLVQLTALAYVIAFVTDVFDDDASAHTAHETQVGDDFDVDVDGALGGGGRVAPATLEEAVTPPNRPGATLADDLVDRDPDGVFGSAEVEGFVPRQCIHTVEGKRPKLTRNEQKRTAAVLAHVVKRMGASPDFGKLLQLIAARESSMQQGLVHRLSPDLEGSLSAWRKTAKHYEGNPHYPDSSLWQTYGLFGMNSNYFTLVWDNQADPQVLCDAIVDILVYRRAAARVIRKAGAAIKCTDADGNSFDYRTKATWETIHRAVSGGKLCPSKSENVAAIMGKYFRGRAAKVGLDPDKPVTLKMLGKEPTRGLDGTTWDDQEEVVMGLWAELEAKWAEDPVDGDAKAKIARKSK